MKILLFLICTSILLSYPHSGFAQTFGCPEKDLDCQLERARKALTEDDSDDPEHLYNLGLVFMRRGQHLPAVRTFTMYLNSGGLKAQYEADGYNNRGISYRALKEYERAIADYSKAIELFPKKASFYANRGNAKRDLGRPDAVDDYTRAISIDPRFAPAYGARGHYYADVEKFGEALADLAKAIELDPTFAEAYYTRAMVYRSLKNFAKAIPDLDKYVTFELNDQYLADGYLNRGIAYESLGNHDQAIKDMTKAIELSPRYVDAYRARAVTYRRMKNDILASGDEKKAAQILAAAKQKP